MEDQKTPKYIAQDFAGWRWKQLGQYDKAGHAAIEARYEAWKAKKASAA